MQSRFKIMLMISLLFFPTIQIYADEDLVTVTVVGEGPDKHSAVQNALRSAVEQVAGVSMQSMSKMKDYSVIYDIVASRTGGYVKSHEVIGEKETGDGLIKVKVNATVSKKLLLNEVDAVYGLLERKGFPRVTVVIDEYVYQPDGQRVESPNRYAENYIIGYLKHYNFNVIDTKTVEMIDEKDRKAITDFGTGDSDDTNTLKRLGVKTTTDIIITGTTEIKSAGIEEYMGTSIKKYSGTLIAKGILASTGQILFAIRAPQDKTNIQGFSSDEELMKTLSEQMIKSSAKSIKDKILKAWLGELGESGYGAGRSVTVVIENIKFETMSMFIDAIKKHPDIKIRREPEMSGDIYEFEISTRIESNMALAGFLKQCCPEGLFEVKRLYKDKIILKHVSSSE